MLLRVLARGLRTASRLSQPVESSFAFEPLTLAQPWMMKDAAIQAKKDKGDKGGKGGKPKAEGEKKPKAEGEAPKKK